MDELRLVDLERELADYGAASVAAADMVTSDKRPGTLRWFILGLAVGWALTIAGVLYILN